MRVNHIIGVSAAVIISAALSASAQVAKPVPQPPLPKPLSTQKTGEAVNLTGCVKAASAPAATEANRATPPEGRSTLATNSYLLTSVEDKDRPSHKEGTTYALVPATGVNIGEHLGHKVQVTGIIEKVDPPAAKTGTSGEERTGDRPPVSAWPVITVTSLMMVSSSCGTTR